MTHERADRRPTVACCVAPHRRRRVEAGLADFAAVAWFDSLVALQESLATTRASAVIVDARDALGVRAAGFASLAASRSGPGAVILYASRNELAGGALASAAITDIIVVDETDASHFVRSIVRRAILRVAARRVMNTLHLLVSGPIADFAQTAIAHPSCGSVEAVSERLGIHRQTAAVWCRRDRFLKPEELLMWCRVLLASAILEENDRPIGAVAMDLEFPSAVSLRNQLKRYTGKTATEIRSEGLAAVFKVFEADVARARTHGAASPENESALIAR